MRILLLISSMKAGGAERVASILANAWADSGHEVVLMMTYSGPTVCEFKLNPTIRICRIDGGNPGTPNQRLNPLTKLLSLRRQISAMHTDVILSFLTNVNVSALIAAAGLNKRIVVAERVSSAADVELSATLRFLRKIVYRFADRLVVQTAAAAAQLSNDQAPPVSVIPNPLPPELSLPRARGSHRTRQGGRARVVAMGRLTVQKRFDIAIRGFATFAATHSEWELLIWGDGPLRHELQRQIDATGYANRIFLCGATNCAWNELADADIFLLTSDYEGFPNAMLEAMALEVPCIATNCPHGPAELAGEDGRYALLVPTNDYMAVGNALDKLAEDVTLRTEIGRRAADSVRRRYAISQVMPLWNQAVGAP